MARPRKIAAGSLVFVLWTGVAAQAQYPSTVVSWEGQPVNVTTAKEVFQRPQFSGSTQGIVLGTEAFNDAFRSNAQGGFDGLQSYQVFFNWVDAANPNAWVRLTTFNTPQLPNPALDLHGKVRLRIKNVSEFFNGSIGLCLGIRETGIDTPQLTNGGSAGTIEWVGATGKIDAIIEPFTGGNGLADTTASGDDVQVIAPGAAATPGATIVAAGANGVLDTLAAAGDITTRVPIPAVIIPVTDWSLVEWDLQTGSVTVDGVPHTGGIVPFNGDGVLSAPNNRGTLEHLAITNVTTDPAVSITFFLDTLQFEATVTDVIPPPLIQAPIIEGATTVTVSGLFPITSQVTLYVDNGVDPPQSTMTSGTGFVTFTLPHPAVLGQTYTATQVVNGITSPLSAGVTVVAVGSLPTVVINEFQYDDAPAGGDDAREFVELYNFGDESVDISGWTLRASDTVAPPGDNNDDYTIPSGTTLAPWGFYVIGDASVPNVNLVVTSANAEGLWENSNEALQLLDAGGFVLDTVIYELNKGAVAVSPGEGGLWGNMVSENTTMASLSRFIDGRDTNNNGRDFGTRGATPGAPNSIATIFSYNGPDVDGLPVGANVPGFHGSFVSPKVIDPAVVDANNLNAIPPSPEGGKAMIAWDPAGGGNISGSNFTIDVNGAYDVWVYIDPTPGLVEQWNIGLAGTADYWAQNNLFLNANGSSGVSWIFTRSASSSGLSLVDHGASGPYATWVTLGTIDLSNAAPGWRRL
ncbi:MAG TPA: lamin tail domain-containing protein, partial [Phycisphaerae bacterium]